MGSPGAHFGSKLRSTKELKTFPKIFYAGVFLYICVNFETDVVVFLIFRMYLFTLYVSRTYTVHYGKTNITLV